MLAFFARSSSPRGAGNPFPTTILRNPSLRPTYQWPVTAPHICLSKIMATTPVIELEKLLPTPSPPTVPLSAAIFLLNLLAVMPRYGQSPAQVQPFGVLHYVQDGRTTKSISATIGFIVLRHSNKLLFLS